MQVYNKGGSHPYELNTYSSHKRIQKEEQLDEYGSMRSDKSSHDTGGMRISNATLLTLEKEKMQRNALSCESKEECGETRQVIKYNQKEHHPER